jgi:hypothetical protein
VHDVADTTRKRPTCRYPVVAASNVKHETTMTVDEESMKHGRVLYLPTTTQLERLMQFESS